MLACMQALGNSDYDTLLMGRLRFTCTLLTCAAAGPCTVLPSARLIVIMQPGPDVPCMAKDSS